jgi:hypothetical protein
MKFTLTRRGYNEMVTRVCYFMASYGVNCLFSSSTVTRGYNKMNKVEIFYTKYHGIYVQREGNRIWLCTETDIDLEMDHIPTEQEIDDFRNEVIN